jgi:hypothetical protein
MGLKSGTDGYAEIQAFGAVGGSPLPYQRACQMSFDIDSSPSAGLVQQDYMAGCIDGLAHQSAEWTQGRSAPR